MEGWRLSFSVSISPNFLSQFWDLEHRSQLPKCSQAEVQAAFDVRDYSEQGVMGRARWDMQEAGLEVEKRSHGAPTVC